MTMGIHVYFRRPPGYRGRCQYVDYIHVENGTTLEDVFKRFTALTSRTGLQHVAFLESLREAR